MREFAQAQVDARLELVLAEMERLRAKPDEDAIHDLRVSIRRLSQGLRLFAPLLGKKPSKQLRNRVRPILKLAGEVRNRDIALGLATEAAFGPRTAIARALTHQRTQELQKLTDLVEFYRSVPLRPRWPLSGAGGDWEPKASPGENARVVLPKMARKFMRAGDKAIAPQTSWTDLHQFRLRGKRFRYTLELFTPVYGPGLDDRIDRLKKVQTSLGEINDCETMLSMDPVPKYPKLVSFLNARRDERRAHFVETWNKSFAGEQAEQRWIHYLERYAR